MELIAPADGLVLQSDIITSLGREGVQRCGLRHSVADISTNGRSGQKPEVMERLRLQTSTTSGVIGLTAGEEHPACPKRWLSVGTVGQEHKLIVGG